MKTFLEWLLIVVVLVFLAGTVGLVLYGEAQNSRADAVCTVLGYDAGEWVISGPRCIQYTSIEEAVELFK